MAPPLGLSCLDGSRRTARSRVRAAFCVTVTSDCRVVTSAHSGGVNPSIVRRTMKAIGAWYTASRAVSGVRFRKPLVVRLSVS